MKTITAMTLLLLPIVGCDTEQEFEPPEFGAEYSLLETSTLPSIARDSVFVRVGYSGCDGNHSFVLDYRIAPLAADMWLVKKTPDQPCLAYFEETKSFPLPAEVSESLRIVLKGPYGKSFSLR